MTLRAKPVVRRSGRPGWDGGDRRTRLINLGFVISIAVSIVLLVGYAAWSVYDDHLGTAATVNGTVITKDQLRARFAVDTFRIAYTEARIQTLMTAGRLSSAEASQQLAFLDQRRQVLGQLALERLIDATLQAQLAEEAGLEVTEVQVDEQLADEATTPEERHAWLIELRPEDDDVTGEPGPEEKAAAKAKADQALADLRAGKSWDEVAKAVSTAASAPQAGDLGWIPRESGYDDAFAEALYAAALDNPTDVVEGADGVYRIGRVTEIAAESVDQAYAAKIADAGMTLEDYRTAVRADVTREVLRDAIVADLSKPGPQRRVVQIFVGASQVVDGIKVRHILFAPKDDPGGAATLPADDPAWAVAEAEAKAAYAELLADPTRFDRMARTLSDEGSAKATGGKQPLYSATSAIDQDFWKAISADGLEPGDLIAPFRTAFGWHIAQYMRPFGDGPAAWLETIRSRFLAGESFGQLARDQGEGAEAARDGDIGWIAAGQLGDLRELPIFAAPLGSVTPVIDIPEEGAYLYKVVAEEVREPSQDQLDLFEANGFDSWYSERRAEADITQDIAASTDVTG